MTYIFTYYGFTVTYSRLNETKETFTLQKEGRCIKIKNKLDPWNCYTIDIFNNMMDTNIVDISHNYGRKINFTLGYSDYDDIGQIVKEAFTTNFEKIFNFIILKTCDLKYLCIRFIADNNQYYKKSELKSLNRDIKKIFDFYHIYDKNLIH